MSTTRAQATFVASLLASLLAPILASGVVLGAASGCGTGGDAGAAATLHGVVWWGGPVAGATVRVYQLVDGERLALLAEDVTGPDGRFDVRAAGYEHLLLVADGGRFVEGGATIAVPPREGLRAIALDVGAGEAREVAITPFTDVLVTLAGARAAAGEPFNALALPRVHERLAAHLGFDPTRGPIAALDRPLAAGDAATRHALALRGLVEIAARAAADLRVSAQDVSTLSLLAALRADAGSAEARLDGNLEAGGLAPLHLGATCAADQPGARASCTITSNTLRSELAGGVLRYLALDGVTGLGRADVLGWVSDLAANDDPELFAGDAPEPADRVAPQLAWVSPADHAVLAAVVTVEVTATDDVGVDGIEVGVVAAGAAPGDPPLVTLADSDPTARRFVGSLDTTTLPEGALALRATARDLDGNRGDSTRAITIDNVHGGTISGVVVKGRVEGATVRIYGYAGGVRGPLLGEGVTASGAAAGTFTNIALADGYSGPLLVEAGGGGRYDEEAGAATVTLDLADTLRTIVPDHGDGGAPSSIVVSPLTSFAVGYREVLASLGAGGTLAEQWQRATEALEARFGIANLRTVVPLAPEQMTTLTAAARHGLVLVGLSELARQASTLGGGDAGTFGLAASSLRVWRAWQQDLADGCWDGRAGLAADAPRIFYGGTQALGDDPTRRALADAIAAYLRSPRNATPFAGVADALPLLDAIATGGGTDALGRCGAAPGVPGTLTPPTTATGFDQVPPAITITPAEGAIVGGAVTIAASATDDVDARPALVITAPAALAGLDVDGDATDADVQATFDSAAIVGAEGPLAITLRAEDDAGVVATETRHLVVDNVAPTFTLATPPAPDPDALVELGGVLWTLSAAPALTGTVGDAHLLDVRALAGPAVLATATITGDGWALALPAGTVPSAADVTIELVARDRAGNRTTITVRLRHDAAPPVLALAPTTVSSERGDLVTIEAALDPQDLRVRHAHAGAAIALGPPTACAIGGVDPPPRVSKYAYLLDAALPPYVDEVAPANPFTWRFAASDDGTGVDPATVAYRVRDIAADTILLPWTPLVTAIPGSYAVTLHRNGGTQPSIPALGTRAGVLELQLRARDRAGRETVVTRCWQHDPLAAPLALDGTAAAATHGPAGSGKYALADLRLDDTSAPIDPIGAAVLSDPLAGAPAGTGLMQLAVRNPTTEPVYLTIDLARPAATYAKVTVLGKRTVDSETGIADCGPAVDASGDPVSPDTTLPWCLVGVPAPIAGTVTPLQAGPTSPAYTVRVWEQVGPGSFSEITASCPTCNQTAPPGRFRRTVRLPPRAVSMFGDPLPARTFWIMPVVQSIVDLRPDGTGPWTELQAGGLIVTGEQLGAPNRRCATSLSVSGGRWRCTAKRTAITFNALVSASFALSAQVSVELLVSIDGATPAAPPGLPTTRMFTFPGWTTSEPGL